MTTPSPPVRANYLRSGPVPGNPASGSESDAPSVEALTGLIPQWRLALRAEDKARGTIDLYTDGTGRYLAWCDTHDVAALERNSLLTWMAHLLDAGAAPGTVRSRQLAVKRFAAWLLATGQLAADPFAGIKGPPQRHALVTPLREDELRALIRTCTHPTFRVDEPFHHVRDEAVIRLMMETGIRAGELIGLDVDDLDLRAGRILVRFGKGGRSRVIPVGPATAQSLRNYLELRQLHPCSERTSLWLGCRGTQFGYDGLGKALRRRAKLAGITDFHPHKLRHTAAHRWLAAGGSESGLMAMAGWTRTDMLVRYTRATATELAAAEACTLNLGDL